MKLTIEELRKVYEEAESAAWVALPLERNPDFDEEGHVHDAALLAVARYVAERQRAVEPTVRMRNAAEASWDSGNRGTADIYRAMSAVAPLVVPE